MKTTIYLLRHTEKLRFWDGPDSLRPLKLTGEKQAIQLSELQELEYIDKIYSSPYSRCIQTVKYLSEKRNIPITIVDNLKERNYGTNKKIIEDFEKNQWLDFDYKQIGGESLKEAQYRIMGILSQIILENKEKTILICSHATAIATIFNYYNHQYNFENFKTITSPDLWCLTYDSVVLEKIEHISLINEELE